MENTNAGAYEYVTLQPSLLINRLYTVHYFEYMKDFAFKGESHDFWEFLYVDKGNILVRAGDWELQMGAGDIVFHEPNEFHAFRAVGKSAINLVAVSFVTDSPGVDFFRERTPDFICTGQRCQRGTQHTDQYSLDRAGRTSGGCALRRTADDFAESGAVFADAAQGAGRKGGRFQTV